MGSNILHQPPVKLRPAVAEEAEGGAVAQDPVESDPGGDSRHTRQVSISKQPDSTISPARYSRFRHGSESTLSHP